MRERRLATRRRSTILLTVVGLGIATALGAALLVLPVRTYVDQDLQIERRRSQLSDISAVVADLESEVARLRTDDGVREAAREELGFVEGGERRESVLDPTGVPTDLPDGWPYVLVDSIVELRRNPPPPPAPGTAAPGTAAPGTPATGTPTAGP